MFLGLLVSLFAASPAQAHVDLNTVEPSVGEIVSLTPEVITLTLSGDPGNMTIELFTRDGKPVPITGNGPEISGNVVTVTPPALDVGTYVLIWQSMGPDGHLAVGQTYFSVGVPSGTVGDFVSQVDTSDPLWAVALRWITYLGIALLFGAAWLAWTNLVGRPARERLLTRAAAGTVLIGAFLQFLAISVRVGGDQGLASGVEQVLLNVPGGPAWAVLFLCAALALIWPRWQAALAGSVLGALALTATGHLGVLPEWPILVPLASAHLIAASIWVGPIGAHLIAGKTGKEEHFEFARKFTYWAMAGVALVGISGVLLMWQRSGIDSVLQLMSFQYGETLALKFGFILLLVAPLGAYHAARVLAALAERYREGLNEPDSSGDPSDSSETHDSPSDTVDTVTQDTDDWTATPITVTSEDDTPQRHTAAMRAPRGLSRVTLLIEAAGLALIVGLGAALAGMNPSPVATTAVSGNVDLLAMPETYEECTQSQGASDELLCLSNYFIGLADRETFTVALEEIAIKWQEQDPWLLKNCHAIGHKLGRHGYQVFGDIAEAFAQGSDPCDYGYLHGVIEGASANFTDAELQAAMTTMCEPVGDMTNHAYRQCIHGLGHAAARRVNNDLPRAMEYCRVYWTEGTDPYGETSIEDLAFNLCVTGVSMEWNTQPKALDAMTLPIAAPGTLMAECVRLDDIFQPGCIEYGTSAMGGIYEREVAARDWCDANLEDPLACYMSIGRDVIWSPTISYEQAVEICMGGRPGEYARQCLVRAMGSVATIALDASAIDNFCPYVPEQHQDMCQVVKDAMELQIEQTTRGFILPDGQDISRKESEQ